MSFAGQRAVWGHARSNRYTWIAHHFEHLLIQRRCQPASAAHGCPFPRATVANRTASPLTGILAQLGPSEHRRLLPARGVPHRPPAMTLERPELTGLVRIGEMKGHFRNGAPAADYSLASPPDAARTTVRFPDPRIGVTREI